MLRRTNLMTSSPSRRPLSRFAQDEEGSLLVFGMCLFLLMIMLGGLAVDLMRYEQRRTALQQTIDRSVLAAASLTQNLTPEVVVNDYFDKAGLKQYLRDVKVTEGVNFRNVKASADADLDPFFAHMVGINEFNVPADSEAQQEITDVEIVLVLDVSGSMNEATESTTKIAAMRKAASDFVATVKAKDTQNRISIAIVPYNAQVNLGKDLREKFNATNLHDVAGVDCLEPSAASFNTLTMSRTVSIPMAAYADTVSGTSTANNWTSPTNTSSSSGATPVANTPHCRITADNLVRLPSGTVSSLQLDINGLQAAGNTSTAIGVRWGLMLLDPASRPMFAELASAGKIPSAFNNRPFDWQAEDTLKVMVVMTDGDHVAHNRVTDAFKSGTSPIFKAPDGNYSIQHTFGRPKCAGTNEFWVPHLWTSGGTQPCGGAWRSTAYTNKPNQDAAPQTWQQMWASQRVTWVAWQLYARALGTNSADRTNKYNALVNNGTSGTMRAQYATDTELDTRMSQTCSLAKSKGIVIYGIAFEAPPQGQAAIADCTTRDPNYSAEDSGYYFNAQGLEISSAFSAIASNISQLRLTQ
jgi:Flp pilus assembly protein TadG